MLALAFLKPGFHFDTSARIKIFALAFVLMLALGRFHYEIRPLMLALVLVSW